MKKILLLFIPLGLFFSCEKDNPDANISSDINQSDNNNLETNCDSLFYIGSPQPKADTYLIESGNMHSGNNCEYDLCYNFIALNGDGVEFYFDLLLDVNYTTIEGLYQYSNNNDINSFTNYSYVENNYGTHDISSGELNIVYLNNNIYEISFDGFIYGSTEVYGCFSGELSAIN